MTQAAVDALKRVQKARTSAQVIRLALAKSETLNWLAKADNAGALDEMSKLADVLWGNGLVTPEDIKKDFES